MHTASNSPAVVRLCCKLLVVICGLLHCLLCKCIHICLYCSRYLYCFIAAATTAAAASVEKNTAYHCIQTTKTRLKSSSCYDFFLLCLRIPKLSRILLLFHLIFVQSQNQISFVRELREMLKSVKYLKVKHFLGSFLEYFLYTWSASKSPRSTF